MWSNNLRAEKEHRLMNTSLSSQAVPPWLQMMSQDGGAHRGRRCSGQYFLGSVMQTVTKEFGDKPGTKASR